MNYKKIPIVMTFTEAVKEKDYLAGSNKMQTIKSWFIDKQYPRFGNINVVPRHFKMFDEVLVNTIDHHFDMANENRAMQVTIINVITTANTITIYNNGMGFPLGDLNILKNALTEQHCSSNHSNPQSMNGGINGLGLKIVTLSGHDFSIYTHDLISRKSAEAIIKKSIIDNIKYVNKRGEGTEIQFSVNIDKSFENLIRRRLFETSLFINSLSESVTVTYNGNVIDGDMKTYLDTLGDNIIINTKTHNNKIMIGFALAKQRRNFISLLNGVSTEGCAFHDKLRKYVTDSLCAIASKEVTFDVKAVTKELKRVMFIVIARRSAHKCYGLSSQTKEKVYVNCDDCVKFTFDCEPIYKLYRYLFKSKNTNNEKLSDYDKAAYAGTSESKNCVLFVVEGLSAKIFVLSLINTKGFPIAREYCGVLSITGVPKNIVKKVDIRRDGNSQKVKFTDNMNPKGIHDIAVAMGLDYNMVYNDDTFVNYGKIILVCDQDLDGIGNISTLIMCGLSYIWPKITPIIRRVNSPILTVYLNNSRSVIFTDEDEYKEWYNKNHNSVKKVLYHKGLGHLTNTELKYLEKESIAQSTVYISENTNIIREYFDKENSDIRRDMLRRGPLPLDNKKLMTPGQHISHYGIIFSMYKNERQIPDYVDGLNISMRKIVYIIRDIKPGSYKIDVLAGKILEKACYDHGISSLQDTLICCAQSWQGTRTIPLLQVVSLGVGNINGRRKDHSEARYIEVYTNPIVSTIYPPIDDQFLEFNIEEGKKCEPKHYCPIIPISILELYKTPGTGWKCESIPRSVPTVISKLVLRLTGMDDTINLDHYTIKYPHLKYIITGKNLKIVGEYIYETDSITIIALPIQMWVTKYVNELKNREWYNVMFSSEPINMTGDDSIVKIVLKIRKSARDKIKALHEDGRIYNLLGITKTYQYNLNFEDNGHIKEFDSYNEIFDKWYERRCEIYKQRYVKITSDLTEQIGLQRDIYNYLSKDFNRDMRHMTTLERYQCYKSLGYLETSFEHLDELKVRDSSKEGISRVHKKLTDLEHKLEIHCKKTWKDLWLEDIDIFCKEYKDGVNRRWIKEF